MRQVVKFLAYDETEFENEAACLEYERTESIKDKFAEVFEPAIKTGRVDALMKAMFADHESVISVFDLFRKTPVVKKSRRASDPTKPKKVRNISPQRIEKVRLKAIDILAKQPGLSKGKMAPLAGATHQELVLALSDPMFRSEIDPGRANVVHYYLMGA